MKRKVLSLTLISTFFALLIFFVSSIFVINGANIKSGKENVRKMTAIYSQRMTELPFSDSVKIPEEIGVTTRLSIIRMDGVVIYDNMYNVEEIGNHGDRLEVASAIKGEPEAAVRRSGTIGESYIYYAQKVVALGGEELIVRVSIPLASINGYFVSAVVILLLVMAVSFLVVSVAGAKLSKSVVAPVVEIGKSLSTLNSGNYKKLSSGKIGEFAPIITGINEVAEKLSGGIGELNEEREKLKFLLDNIDEGIVAVGKNNEMFIINQKARETFGATNGLLGKDLSFLTENRTLLENFYYSTECKHFRLEHNGRTYLCKSSPLAGREMSVLILSDITEEAEVQEQKSRFFESASHELRTPLTSVKGFTELLEKEANISEDGKKFLAMMGADIDRLLTLISDMLALSRLEGGKVEARTEKIGLRGMCEDILANFKSSMQLKGIEARISGEGEIMFDRSQLAEMLTNLIDNAIKYNKGKGKIDIAINGKTMTIKDTGIGIAKKHIPRIFERFYRVDKARSSKEGGTGLGLAIVKHIALANAASVSLESVEGVGSKFVIIFE